MRILILVFILSSCSSTFHLKRAIKKDPEILQERIVTDTISIPKIDSIPVLVNDTITYKHFKTFTDTIIETKYKYIKNPKTRQEIRLEAKSDRITIRKESQSEKLNQRLEKRIEQTEIRNSGGGWKLWLFLFIVGFFTGMFISFRLKK